MLTDGDIAIVKDGVDMKELVKTLGFKVDRAGFTFCPFHQGDRTASMKLYPGKRGYYCFACHKGGNVIQFVMQYLNMDFEPATRYLADVFRLPISDPENMSKEDLKAQIKAAEKRREDAKRIEDERKAKQHRLNEVAGKMHSIKRMLDRFEPLGDVWCRLINKYQSYENEWCGLFEELYGDRRRKDHLAETAKATAPRRSTA